VEVKLVSHTVEAGVDHWQTNDPEALLVSIARVSSSRENKSASPEKLIGYLIRNKHWSPFEMLSACVEIVTSRAIAQQILRHRSFSYQEFSQRYAEVIDIEPVEMRLQAEHNRQSSTEVITDPLMEAEVRAHFAACQNLYRRLLDRGAAKECARMVLPLATQTRLYMSGTLRSWIHYLQVRDDSHAQLEHQRIAIEIKKALRFFYPHTWAALGW
jgi:thymidylate synthase (FAD)